MDSDYVRGKIRNLIAKPWMEDRDLLSIYTILVALPLSNLTGGALSQLLAELAQVVDADLKTTLIQRKKETT